MEGCCIKWRVNQRQTTSMLYSPNHTSIKCDTQLEVMGVVPQWNNTIQSVTQLCSILLLVEEVTICI